MMREYYIDFVKRKGDTAGGVILWGVLAAIEGSSKRNLGVQLERERGGTLSNGKNVSIYALRTGRHIG